VFEWVFKDSSRRRQQQQQTPDHQGPSASCVGPSASVHSLLGFLLFISKWIEGGNSAPLSLGRSSIANRGMPVLAVGCCGRPWESVLLVFSAVISGVILEHSTSASLSMIPAKEDVDFSVTKLISIEYNQPAVVCQAKVANYQVLFFPFLFLSTFYL